MDAMERHRPWEEKSAVLSGLLAFLIPGAGHFYQGRWFKGTIYFVCILGTFFGGMKLGEGAVVYNTPGRGLRKVSLTYIAQVGVGLVALPALYQASRVEESSNRPSFDLAEPLDAEFEGRLVATGPGQDDPPAVVRGRIELATTLEGAIPETRGRFVGMADTQPVELELSGPMELDRPIDAGSRRRLAVQVSRHGDQHPHASLQLVGSIPRPLTDWYTVPPDSHTLQDRHRRLGKLYDLAVAFTMIAGLLNVLAIWDALEGPAYGFGDEPGLPGNRPLPEPSPTPTVATAPAVPTAPAATKPAANV